MFLLLLGAPLVDLFLVPGFDMLLVVLASVVAEVPLTMVAAMSAIPGVLDSGQPATGQELTVWCQRPPFYRRMLPVNQFSDFKNTARVHEGSMDCVGRMGSDVELGVVERYHASELRDRA